MFELHGAAAEISFDATERVDLNLGFTRFPAVGFSAQPSCGNVQA